MREVFHYIYVNYRLWKQPDFLGIISWKQYIRMVEEMKHLGII